MLTRTAAADFVGDGIYMTAVDVGWISTGTFENKRVEQFEQLKIPPFDPFDGAMHIVHPIAGVTDGDRSLFGILQCKFFICKCTINFILNTLRICRTFFFTTNELATQCHIVKFYPLLKSAINRSQNILGLDSRSATRASANNANNDSIL